MESPSETLSETTRATGAGAFLAPSMRRFLPRFSLFGWLRFGKRGPSEARGLNGEEP